MTSEHCHGAEERLYINIKKCAGLPEYRGCGFLVRWKRISIFTAGMGVMARVGYVPTVPQIYSI